jgi:hypothetical protein
VGQGESFENPFQGKPLPGYPLFCCFFLNFERWTSKGRGVIIELLIAFLTEDNK